MGSSAPRRSWSHAPAGRAPATPAGSAPRRVVSICPFARPGARRRMAAPDGCRGPPGTSRPVSSAGALAASGSSGPCASRVTSAGDDGARSATWRSATRMSSGRTAGVTCRTTIRSMAFPVACVSAHRSVSIVITAARASIRLLPLAVRRSTSTLPLARKASAARPASSGSTPGRTTCQCDASSRRSARDAGPSITSITSIPSGRAASSRSRTSEAAHVSVKPISKYSASLAVPVGAAPA